MSFDRTLRNFTTSLSNATMAGSLALVISFCTFLALKFPIEVTAVWMFAIGALGFGGTYAGSFIGLSLRKDDGTHAAKRG